MGWLDFMKKKEPKFVIFSLTRRCLKTGKTELIEDSKEVVEGEDGGGNVNPFIYKHSLILKEGKPAKWGTSFGTNSIMEDAKQNAAKEGTLEYILAMATSAKNKDMSKEEGDQLKKDFKASLDEKKKEFDEVLADLPVFDTITMVSPEYIEIVTVTILED